MSKKNYILLAVALGLALTSCVYAASTDKSAAPGWTIDTPLRFQLAYVPDKHAARHGNKPKSMGLKADYLPDIDNIILANIKALGFNLPDRESADQYKLYLKLFNFPDSLSPKQTASPLIHEFQLDKTVGGPMLEEYVSQRDNLAVKYAYVDKADRQFTKENPFPQVVIPGKSQFNKDVTFCSLYVKPASGSGATGSEDEQAKASTAGVMAFHKELLESYFKNLKPAKGPDPDKNLYFCADGEKCSKVLKVLANPMVISDWRNAPMPTSDKDFLSALLLIYYMDNSSAGMTPKIVFEVGSLMRRQ